MPQLLKNPYIRRILVISALDMVYFSIVTPSLSHSITLLGGYVLIILSLLWGLQVVLRALRKAVGRPKGHIDRLAAGGTAVGVLLLALQSVGQLSLRDILVVVGLAVLAYLYSLYLWPRRKP